MTSRVSPPGSVMLASGWAWRLSHQAGSGSIQPFIAGTMMFGPSSMKPRIATRVRPVRRPTVVNRSIPHRLAAGVRSPKRPPVMAYARRWTNQIVRISQCGTLGDGLASMAVMAVLVLFTV